MNFDSLNYRNNSKIGRTVLIGNEVKNTPPINRCSQDLITFSNGNSAFSMSKDDLSKGLLLIGSPGSGKTNVILSMLDSIISRLNDDDILFIFDSKQDFMGRYYNQNNPNHVIISANEEHSALTSSWNLFGELLNDDNNFNNAEIMANEISKSLFADVESENQPFFHISASDIFKMIVCSFVKEAVTANDCSALNNKKLIDYIKGSTVEDLYKLLCKYPEYKYVQTYLGNPKNLTPQALGVMGYLNSMINTQFIGPFCSRSENGEFSIRKLVREKGAKVVFIEYDMLLGKTLSPMYSLLFDLIIKNTLKNGEGNVFLFADELHLLPYCNELQAAVNAGRSRGLKTVIGLQNINQLYDNYGEDKGKAIAAGFVNAFCFNSVDYDTRKFISERFGRTFESINYLGSNLTRDGFTVEDYDIHNLNTGEAFIDLVNTPPFKFQFGKVI